MVQVLLKTIWFATLHQANSIRFHPPFLTFLRSRGGSFRALMIREAALGTTSTRAWRFWTTSFTVIFSPFQSAVVLAMSSPTFLGDCCKKAKDFADTHIANAGNMSKYCTTDVRTKASLGFQQPNIPIAGPWASSPNIRGWPLEDVYIWSYQCGKFEKLAVLIQNNGLTVVLIQGVTVMLVQLYRAGGWRLAVRVYSNTKQQHY